jgi:hypothetical protein
MEWDDQGVLWIPEQLEGTLPALTDEISLSIFILVGDIKRTQKKIFQHAIFHLFFQ